MPSNLDDKGDEKRPVIYLRCLNSRNSSQPLSTDRFPARAKKPQGGARKPGGQLGRLGTTLKKSDDPDVIEFLAVDRCMLPPGDYQDVGYVCRQVFDIDISRVATKYRAQILQDRDGRRYTALEQFERQAIAKLLTARVLHADETGINIDAKTHWLHCVSHPQWTLYYAHPKRGTEAMIAKAVLPHFAGIR
jgi:hypothetical protein